MGRRRDGLRAETDERERLFRFAAREFAIPLASTSLLRDGPVPNSAYFAAITSPADIDAAARELARIRERYHEDGMSVGAVRPRIAESWNRCHALHVDPNRKYAPLQNSLDDLRAANERLLRAVRPTVARLLNLTGDRVTRRVLARLNFEHGSDWSEAAIADRRPLQLLGAEHFCDGPQPFTCTAAPIRALADGEIAGVLDISGPYALVRPHLLGVIMQAALEIEERLALL